MAERTFDLEQAERLLPQLERLLRTALESRKHVLEMEQEYAAWIESILMMGGRQVNIVEFSRRTREKECQAASLRQAAEEIESYGCQLKDLEIGLVDFPCRIRGREMYLCWKLGERSIQFWHLPEEGFAGRKPIDAKLMRQLKPSRPV